MAVIIFRLKDVPEDEADEVRELLRANHLDFYETSAGKWGISIAAIWLKDDSQKERARALIDDYQSKKKNKTGQGGACTVAQQGRARDVCRPYPAPPVTGDFRPVVCPVYSLPDDHPVYRDKELII
jgi:hypothetical protein